jgi:hypothetical protein
VGLALRDAFPYAIYIGSTGLAPFHDFASEIPQPIQVELEAIRDDLLNDRIVYESFH